LSKKANAWYDKLKKLRQDSGKTQKQICEELGLNHTKTYIRWENGENVPLPIYRAALAVILGTSAVDLFGVDPETKN